MDKLSDKKRKLISAFLLAASVLAFIGGIAAFVILFVPDFNIYWLILSPVILAVYWIPAAVLFRLHRKFKKYPEDVPDLNLRV